MFNSPPTKYKLRIDQISNEQVIPVSQGTRVTIQTVAPRGGTYTWTTAVLTAKRSISGNKLDAQALESPVTISAAGIITIPVIDMAFLHIIVTTAEGTSGSEIEVWVYVNDYGA